MDLSPTKTVPRARRADGTRVLRSRPAAPGKGPGSACWPPVAAPNPPPPSRWWTRSAPSARAPSPARRSRPRRPPWPAAVAGGARNDCPGEPLNRSTTCNRRPSGGGGVPGTAWSRAPVDRVSSAACSAFPKATCAAVGSLRRDSARGAGRERGGPLCTAAPTGATPATVAGSRAESRSHRTTLVVSLAGAIPRIVDLQLTQGSTPKSRAATNGRRAHRRAVRQGGGGPRAAYWTDRMHGRNYYGPASPVCSSARRRRP